MGHNLGPVRQVECSQMRVIGTVDRRGSNRVTCARSDCCPPLCALPILAPADTEVEALRSTGEGCSGFNLGAVNVSAAPILRAEHRLALDAAPQEQDQAVTPRVVQWP